MAAPPGRTSHTVLGLSAPNASDGSRIAAVATIIFTIALGNEVKRKRGSAADKIEEQIFIRGWVGDGLLQAVSGGA